jgi:hypothetical protein
MTSCDCHEEQMSSMDSRNHSALEDAAAEGLRLVHASGFAGCHALVVYLFTRCQHCHPR